MNAFAKVASKYLHNYIIITTEPKELERVKLECLFRYFQ